MVSGEDTSAPPVLAVSSACDTPSPGLAEKDLFLLKKKTPEAPFFRWSRLGVRLRRSPIRDVSMPAIERKAQGHDVALLAGGMPHESLFPLSRVSATTVNGESFDLPHLAKILQYTPGAGIAPLRALLAEIQTKVHTTPVVPACVCATVGSTDGIVKVIELLSDEGDDLFAEAYTWAGMLAISTSRGRNVMSCDVDAGGLTAEGLEKALLESKSKKKNDDAKKPLLYTISSGHNPLGVTASLERKRAVYEVCCKYDVIILEDDPYYYLAMDSSSEKSPLQKLQASYLSIDAEKRVIRLDSFAKILSPGMRLGCVTCLREEFVSKFSLLQEQSTQHPSGLAQSTFVGLFQTWGFDGFFEQHLAVIQAEYLRRRDVLLAALEEALAKAPQQLKVTYTLPSEGMFLWLDQNAVADASDIDFAEAGVACVPGCFFRTSDCGTRTGGPCPFLRLTYAAANDADLKNGAHRVVSVLAEKISTTL